VIDEEFWSELYSTLATECGYTPEEIRSMTLHDVDRITKGWNKAPPPRMLLMAIGAALGIKFQPTKLDKPKYMTADEARALMRATGGKIEGVGKVGHG